MNKASSTTRWNIKAGLVLTISLCLSAPGQASAQSRVSVGKTEAGFGLALNGKPYKIKGAGGDTFLAELKAAGGNTVRTWDSANLGRVLDAAQEHGLMVCAGLWMGHQRHGFNYQNQQQVLKQFDEKVAFVRQHKNHPALLMWAVGNEAEGAGTDPSVWYAINHVARAIKAIDSNHPTMTVVAEVGENAEKVKSIERFCPDIDIVGVNSYGGIESLGQRYRAAGGTKPYVITEHGTLGPWEVGKTAWGSPDEWTSTRKAEFYAKGYEANATDHAGLCLGTFAFIWGHKQETTATWFGMLLPDGTRLGAADAMSECWSGSAPRNRCPEIATLLLSRTTNLKPGATIKASVIASDPEDDKLTYKWVLRSDGGTIGEGGDPQEAEAVFAKAVNADGKTATVTVPNASGGYRLFAYVYDGNGGAAVANVPFLNARKMSLKKPMQVAALPYVVYGDGAEPGVYVPSGYMGNAGSIAMTEDCKDKPHDGQTCLKVEYKAADAWGGVLWQSPAEDWDGKQPGGANLTGATHLEFYARGARGGETVNFVFGVLDGDQPYRDTAKGELKSVRLTKDWEKLKFPLKGLDLRQIKTGFGWSLAGQGKPVTFYLDDIRYVRGE